MTKTGRTMKKTVLGGKGKLTDTTIHNFGRYFNKAIRNNKTGIVEEMRRACMSGFMLSLALIKIQNMNTALQARTLSACIKKLSH